MDLNIDKNEQEVLVELVDGLLDCVDKLSTFELGITLLRKLEADNIADAYVRTCEEEVWFDSTTGEYNF